MWRRKKQSAWAKVKAGQPIGFGNVAEQRAARKSALSTHIRQVRERIFLLRRTCQACSGMRWRECSGLPDQMHEDPPRSETRGRLPEERFNERICVRLCG